MRHNLESKNTYSNVNKKKILTFILMKYANKKLSTALYKTVTWQLEFLLIDIYYFASHLLYTAVLSVYTLSDLICRLINILFLAMFRSILDFNIDKDVYSKTNIQNRKKSYCVSNIFTNDRILSIMFLTFISFVKYFFGFLRYCF